MLLLLTNNRFPRLILLYSIIKMGQSESRTIIQGEPPPGFENVKEIICRIVTTTYIAKK